MKRAVALLTAGFLCMAILLPTSALASASTWWAKGPSAFAQWNRFDGDLDYMTGIFVYEETVAPDHHPGQWVFVFDELYDSTGFVSGVCGFADTSSATIAVDWPHSAVAVGHVDLYVETSTGCDGAFVKTVAFDATWTGYGQVINRRDPAYVEKTSPFEHYVSVGSSVRRPAELSLEDPFAGAFDLGTDYTLIRLTFANERVIVVQ